MIQVTGLKGTHKLADKWSEEVYTVISQPNAEIPVYEVKMEKGRGKPKVLHRNLLLPIPCSPLDIGKDVQKPELVKDVVEDIVAAPDVVSADVESVEFDTESTGTVVLSVPAPVSGPRGRRGNLPVVTPRRLSETTPAMSASREYVASPDGDVNLSIIEHEESVNTDINEFEEEIVNSVMESEEVFSPLLEPDDHVSELESEGVNSTTEFIEVPVGGCFNGECRIRF